MTDLTPKILIGGHTAEALLLLSSLDFERYTPRTYIISQGDTLSAQKAIDLERSRAAPNSVRHLLTLNSRRRLLCIQLPKNYRIIVIPRARHVHQSLLTTPFTFVYSAVFALYCICIKPLVRRNPFSEVLLLNGPGTCVSVCLAAYVSRVSVLVTGCTLRQQLS